MNNLLCKHILSHFDYISFDIFDTLIERDVNRPSDIFCLTGKNIIDEENAEEFCKLRKEAETKARRNNPKMEVTLEEIYNELDGVYEYSVKEKLKHEEMKLEVLHCHRKKDMIAFYEKCLEMKKHIVIISDMYMPAELIEKILNQCNIIGYEKVYVSNEYSVNKISSELFKIVMKEKQIDPSKIIHIGDSFKADFCGARKAGIKSILISRKHRLKRLIHS